MAVATAAYRPPKQLSPEKMGQWPPSTCWLGGQGSTTSTPNNTVPTRVHAAAVSGSAPADSVTAALNAPLSSMRPSRARFNRHDSAPAPNLKKRSVEELDELTYDCERILKRMTLDMGASASGDSARAGESPPSAAATHRESSTATSPTSPTSPRAPWGVSKLLLALPKRAGKRHQDEPPFGAVFRRRLLLSPSFGSGDIGNDVGDGTKDVATAAGCTSRYVDRPPPFPLRYGSLALVPYSPLFGLDIGPNTDPDEESREPTGNSCTRAQQRNSIAEAKGHASRAPAAAAVFTTLDLSEDPIVIPLDTPASADATREAYTEMAWDQDMSCGDDEASKDPAAVVDKGVRVAMAPTGEYHGGCSLLRECWIEEMAPDESL